MTVRDFIAKWGRSTLKETAADREHFIDLCRLLGQPTPAEADPHGAHYAFQKHVTKTTGGKGYADVWKDGHFALEYKGKRKSLQDAYLQLLLYREDLGNPPLLIVSDFETFELHTNFTGTTKRVYRLSLEDLQQPEQLELLRHAFTDPERLNPKHQRERVTEAATAEIGQIALRLRDRGFEPERVAHFLMQLVFALFAEDVGLLPNKLVTKILARTGSNPARAEQYLTMLFEAMATGGEVLLEDVPYFNGGLFDGSPTLPLESGELHLLHQAATLDWAEVEPAIFGTLFERSLDPAKRSQLGAHYTSREDILRVVGPVVIAPLRERFETIRAEVEARLERGHHLKAQELVSSFLNDLHRLRVLDPACGSGNFLYVAMQQLKDLEKDALTLAQSIGAPGFALIGPRQFHGVEVNVFAQELASMVVWIGYLQWNRANGESNYSEPILERLDNIRLHDALMTEDGSEFEWPEAEFIIGNPPFLGDKRMRSELGDGYVEGLRRLYGDRLPGQSDFVAYWLEKARAMIAVGQAKRAGLIATNSIRGGANRRVLERIKDTGDIFMAWSDEPWVLDGAAVRVSLVGFDDGSQQEKVLNGQCVPQINPDLTSAVDVTKAKPLTGSMGMAFIGIQKDGPCDIPGDLARAWLSLPNPSGRKNADVIRPWMNGFDITRGSRDMWLIDFASMSLEEAQEYLVPFAHVEQHVKPTRVGNRDRARREKWWRPGRSNADLRNAVEPLTRFVITPRVSKFRLFAWVTANVLPDSATVAVARDDDYTFGVLHSKLHEVWSLRQGTSLGVGNDPRYTPSTCFETFPFPCPTDVQRAEVGKWAKYLDDVRNQLLAADERLTMTGLYNELEAVRESRGSSARAYPLLIAHERLDAAVAAAYGWEWPLGEDEVLGRLLALNLERASETRP